MPLLCLFSSHFSNWNISAILNDVFIFAKTLKAIRGQYWLFTCQISLFQWKLLLSYCTQVQKASQIILHRLQVKPKRNHHLKEKKKLFIKETLALKLKPCVSIEQSVKLELGTPGKKQLFAIPLLRIIIQAERFHADVLRRECSLHAFDGRIFSLLCQ